MINLKDKKTKIIGLSGGQGAGKSTITGILKFIFKRKYNLDLCVFSIDDFYNTSSFVSALENRQGLKIACLEEIALKNNWIDKKNIFDAIKFYGNCIYSDYLKKLVK